MCQILREGFLQLRQSRASKLLCTNDRPQPLMPPCMEQTTHQPRMHHPASDSSQPGRSHHKPRLA